jgi:short-subunit dehydrogenase
LTDCAAIDAMLAAVADEVGTVDILVNNAGFGDMGMFDLADWTKTKRMIDVNVTALCYLTHRLVGPMVARGRGGVLMVSSGFGLTFLPGFAGYVGTKHFVSGFSESLRLDLRSSGVVVTQICPGPVATEFEEHVGNFVGRPQGFAEISAERCARVALRGLERGRAVVIPGVIIGVAMLLARLTPRWLLRLIYAPGARWLRKKQTEHKSS